MQKEWNNKNGSIWLFQKLGSQSAPKPIVGPKTPLKGPKLARFSCSPTNYFWAKKNDSNRTPQRTLPFTWNQPDMALSSSKERLVTFLHEKEILFCGQYLTAFAYIGVWLCSRGGTDIEEVLRSSSPRFTLGQDSPSSEHLKGQIKLKPWMTNGIFWKSIYVCIHWSDVWFW